MVGCFHGLKFGLKFNLVLFHFGPMDNIDVALIVLGCIGVLGLLGIIYYSFRSVYAIRVDFDEIEDAIPLQNQSAEQNFLVHILQARRQSRAQDNLLRRRQLTASKDTMK